MSAGKKDERGQSAGPSGSAIVTSSKTCTFARCACKITSASQPSKRLWALGCSYGLPSRPFELQARVAWTAAFSCIVFRLQYDEDQLAGSQFGGDPVSSDSVVALLDGRPHLGSCAWLARGCQGGPGKHASHKWFARRCGQPWPQRTRRHFLCEGDYLLSSSGQFLLTRQSDTTFYGTLDTTSQSCRPLRSPVNSPYQQRVNLANAEGNSRWCKDRSRTCVKEAPKRLSKVR